MRDDRAGMLAERYNLEACAYRDFWAPVLRVAGRRLLSEFEGTSVARVIDIGAGVGSLAPDIVTTFPGAWVLAIDRSPGMLALAPAWLSRVVADARHLAVASYSVELVLMVFVLFHLEHPLEGLQEARRVLRFGARLGTVTWGGAFDSKAGRIWTECLDEYGAAQPDPTAAQIWHSHVDTAEKVAVLLRAAGFTSIRAWEEEFVSIVDSEHLWNIWTRLGGWRIRFDSLQTAAQEACIKDARRRMDMLTPADFVARGKVVNAVARAT